MRKPGSLGVGCRCTLGELPPPDHEEARIASRDSRTVSPGLSIRSGGTDLPGHLDQSARAQFWQYDTCNERSGCGLHGWDGTGCLALPRGRRPECSATSDLRSNRDRDRPLSRALDLRFCPPSANLRRNRSGSTRRHIAHGAPLRHCLRALADSIGTDGGDLPGALQYADPHAEQCRSTPRTDLRLEYRGRCLWCDPRGIGLDRARRIESDEPVGKRDQSRCWNRGASPRAKSWHPGSATRFACATDLRPGCLDRASIPGYRGGVAAIGLYDHCLRGLVVSRAAISRRQQHLRADRRTRGVPFGTRDRRIIASARRLTRDARARSGDHPTRDCPARSVCDWQRLLRSGGARTQAAIQRVFRRGPESSVAVATGHPRWSRFRDDVAGNPLHGPFLPTRQPPVSRRCPPTRGADRRILPARKPREHHGLGRCRGLDSSQLGHDGRNADARDGQSRPRADGVRVDPHTRAGQVRLG